MSLAALIASLLLLAAPDAAAPPAAPPPAAAAAPAAAPKEQILGVWKGTSTCTKAEVNEFCRDEIIVYNFVDVAGQPATVSLKAARLVDEIVQPMYSLYFTYDPKSGTWSSEFERPRFRGRWSYVIRGQEMTGTATLIPQGTIVRDVVAKRASPEELPAH